MRITHVIRGDDHLTNTFRQCMVYDAMGWARPHFAHVPLIHGADGAKLSKRHGAVSVLDFREQGYLPDAVCNYLVRLGWSHGDEEIFTRAQLVAWFDGDHITRSPARFDFDKLRWLNNHYLKLQPDAALVPLVAARLGDHGVQDPAAAGVDLAAVCGLLKERSATLEELAEGAMMFFVAPHTSADELAERLPPGLRPAIDALALGLETVDWHPASIAPVIRAVVAEHRLKMPQLGMPVRQLVFGRAQTPALEAVLALLPRATVLHRLRAALAHAL